MPADLRADVDGVLKNDFGPLAYQMKDGLNLWQGGALNLEETQLYQTISGFAGAMSTIGDGFAAYGEVMVTLVHATERVAVGFVPYVGPALDLCEVVTGKEWCLPSGKELSTEERIFSGVGFAVSGVANVWGGVGNAAITPAAKEVAKDISQFGEELAVLVRANRRTRYKTLSEDLWRHGVPVDEVIAVTRAAFKPGSQVDASFGAQWRWLARHGLSLACDGEEYDRRYPTGPLRVSPGGGVEGYLPRLPRDPRR